MANKTFSKRIKKLRLDHNLTLETLAKKLDITISRISMWESNGTVPREDILVRLSRLYGVSIDYMLGNDALEGSRPEESDTLVYIKKSLEKLDNDRLLKAESILKTVFEDIFEEENL